MSGDAMTELRPDSSEYLDGLRARGSWLAPVVAIYGAGTVGGLVRGGSDAVVAVLLLLVVVGGLGCAALHIRTSVMRLTPGGLEHDGLFVRSRSIDLDGATGLLAPMGGQLSAPTVTVLAVRSRAGETIRINGGLWTPEDLERIARHAAVPIEQDQISGTEFGRRVPGAIPVRFRRPMLFAIAVFLPLFAAVVAVSAWESRR